MTSGTVNLVAERLANLGLDDEAARSRAALVARTDDAFARLVSGGARWRWIVPGRIEVFGRHTDYAGGRSLLAAAPRGFAVVARERDDGLVRVIDARYQETATIDPASGSMHEPRWPKYVATVAHRFGMNFPGAKLGTDMAIASDLPRAAGLSSSSAIVVATALVLARRAGLEARHEWQQSIRTPLDLAAYLGCVENGQAFGPLQGTVGVGTEGGSADHTAILASRPDTVGQYGFVPVRDLGGAVMPPAWHFVVASSGVHADKAGTARVRFNRASLAARTLLEVWNRGQGRQDRSLGTALASMPEALGRLHALVAESSVSGFTADELSMRLAHFHREDARVPEAFDACRRGDARTMGSLAATSQRDAEILLGNQVPETVTLAAEATAQGARGAASFGAGFGGSVWALVDAADASAFGRAWVAAYRRRYPDRQAVEWFVARPGPAAVELS